MLRLSPEHIRIGLGASYVAIAKTQGKRINEWHFQAIATQNPTEPWRPAVEKLMLLLAEIKPSGANISIALSSELAMLHLLPWRDEVNRAEQQSLLANSHFRRVYGGKADQWKISVQATGYGKPWLASAIDQQLLNTLNDVCKSNKGDLVSAYPLAISLFNQHRKSLKESAWLLVQEPQQLVAMYITDGIWQILQTIPVHGLSQESMSDVLRRESRLAGLEDAPSMTYLMSDQQQFKTLNAHAQLLDAGYFAHGNINPDKPFYLLGASTS